MKKRKVMEKLIDFGLDINEPANGDSLLKVACFEGNVYRGDGSLDTLPAL